MKKFRTKKFQTKYFETNISNKILGQFLRHFEQNHRLITQNYFTQKLFSIISGKKFSKKKQQTNKQINFHCPWFLMAKYSDFWIFLLSRKL